MISVVIPLYNKVHTIANTLTTVMSQTYQDFEVVIVNDGSTDNGVEVIDRHFHDPRIRIINQENAGVSAARNKGVKEAKGDWIAFLDGDDEWHPEYLAIIQKTIIKYPNAGMICTGGECCSINNENKYSYRIAKKYVNKIRIVNFFENPCVFSHTSGLTINKEIFYKTHGFPVGMKCCEDYACTQAIALISPTIYIGLPISKYNGGVEGQITSIDASTRFKYLKYVVDYYNLVMNDYIISNQKNKLFKIYFKYDIRHRIKGFIIGKDYKSLDFFIDNLSSENKKLLFRTEIQMYKKRYNLLSVLWILLTKCIWRIHNFPVVGEKINTRKINSKYLSW
ncbi:glycosyltransferase family 2 protein [Phocaeicola salanitronis]|uniref:glycosyltransferase family 2 protein n=1 Tax=Phocaeicola salanitronis TaxID=376805 RepID=UPI0023F74E88|nr:glycosyltransferase family 2 protein [Phocaeicola salanitronis]